MTWAGWGASITTGQAGRSLVVSRQVLRRVLDAPPGARDRGNFIHDAIDRLMKAHPSGPLPDDALAQLEGFGRDAFDRALAAVQELVTSVR